MSECHECGTEIDMCSAVADPLGNPLCKECFNSLVRAGRDKSEDRDWV